MSIQIFENPEFQLRVSPDGTSFRVDAPGLARALGFRESFDLVRHLPEDEKGSELVRTPGGDQRVWYVTEAGFYRAVGQRQTARIKDEAVRGAVARFQGWVYGEVLPAIRRLGGYQGAPAVTVTPMVARLAEIAHEEHVVPAAGSILAHHRWNNTQKGIERFDQLRMQLEFEFPASPEIDGKGEQDQLSGGNGEAA